MTADGEWIPRSRLTEIPSGTARARDLRKAEFGSFQVECNPNKVTKQQIEKLFQMQ